MRPKKLLLILIALAFAFIVVGTGLFFFMSGSDCNGFRGDKRIAPKGEIVKVDKDVTDFTEVELNGSFHVFIKQADVTEVEIVTHSNIHEFIEMIQEADRLVLKQKCGFWLKEPVRVYIKAPDLDKIEVNGASELTMDEPFKTDHLILDCKGASEANLNINCRHFEADIKGASEVDVEGTAETCNLNIRGAADYDAAKLFVKSQNIDIKGAGEARVNAEENLNVDVSGAAEVKYYGSPQITKKIRGAGDITKIGD